MRHRFRRKSRALAALAAGTASAALLGTGLAPAAAQTPFPSYAYIVGRANGLDLASNSEIQGPDGRDDGWLRLLVRSPGYYIAEATGRLDQPALAGAVPTVPAPPSGSTPPSRGSEPIGGQVTFGGVSGGRSGFVPGISGYYLKSITLRHKSIPGLRWDTIPGNTYPLLVLSDENGIINQPNGSVAGYMLSRDRFLDMYVADPGHIGWRVAGFVLDIDTLDGRLTLDVQHYNIYEANYLY
ncbi:MAG: hypothetical protein L6R19_02445 [Alphaproteobacteria bacterium]|nr:hypothetical protein [Alphaproteobacteria bacterium]